MSSIGQRRAAWKPSYALIWTNASAAKLIQDIAPHVRVKSRQCAALLQFQRHLRAYGRARDSLGRILATSSREWQVREAFYNRLKRLNTRDTTARRRQRRDHVRPDRSSSPCAKYLAGFIDGEGSLMISKAKNRAHWNPQYRPRISISNTDRIVLEDMRRAYGGILVCERRAQRGWNDLYQLVWVSGIIERVLPSIVPHLIIKREQAAALSDLIHHMHRTHQGRRGHNRGHFAPLPARVVAYRERLYRHVKCLNARGVLPKRDRKAKGGEPPGRRSISRSAFPPPVWPPTSSPSATG